LIHTRRIISRTRIIIIIIIILIIIIIIITITRMRDGRPAVKWTWVKYGCDV